MAWAAKDAVASRVMAVMALPAGGGAAGEGLSVKVDTRWRGRLCSRPIAPIETNSDPQKRMIDKTYQPSDVEGRISQAWEEAGAFRAGRPERAGAETYAIVIPPPNVTGSLHMGHALNNTLQDVLCRFERMRGKDVLWQPGTDHAGIATQMVVERQMMERQEPSRRDIGRDKFLEKVWAWKAESGGTIVNQLKRLGASCDWSRERFTMDEGLSKAVLKVFVELYRDGLIYKDKRLVNWDPKLLTAISDLEVVPVETKGSLWHLRYPIEGKTFNPEDKSTYIVVATTRPETMLGDSGVAVHPDDERYKALVGKNVILPLVGRKIPIIADEYSDPEKGSGAVKITPAHDFNDFEVGKRHNLAQINIFSVEADLALQGNEAFVAGVPASADLDETLAMHGTDRFVARKQLVGRLEEKGLIEKIEPHGLAVPHGDRSNVVIEPFLTDQWYVNAHELAKPAIAAVRDGRTTFVPKNWEATYFNWMENIQPWCISRQLWWGHQIPAWYGLQKISQTQVTRSDKEIFVAESAEEARALAKKCYGTDVVVLNNDAEVIPWMHRILAGEKLDVHPIIRDDDVLDTWFSSALWPFSTLGWPEETGELNRFYPTNTLVTGFDIIFFWVARMMMMGMHFMKNEKGEAEIPFKDVYIHRLVRDASGAKMSKSKGNVVDPLGLIDEFGADALRFTLMRAVAPSHDIRLGPQDVENNRNFATKLWNAARFVEFNGAARVAGFDPKGAKEVLNRWIAHETQKALEDVTAAIADYKFAEAANAAYRFVWNVYCDWYVELSKPVLTGPDGGAKDETRAMAAWALDEIIKMLHPFMPFITEELWRVTAEQGPQRETLLALAPWPKLEGLTDDAAEAEIGWVIDLITAIRSERSALDLPAAAPLPLVIVSESTETKMRALRWEEFIKRLGRISAIGFAGAPSKVSYKTVVRGDIIELSIGAIIALDTVIERLSKELKKAEDDIDRVEKKLGNPKFVERAEPEVVEEERAKREEALARKAKIAEAIERLKGAA